MPASGPQACSGRAVPIDESGGNDEAGGVHDGLAPQRQRGNRRNPIVLYADGEHGLGVDDSAVGNNDVVDRRYRRFGLRPRTGQKKARENVSSSRDFVTANAVR